MIKRPLKIEVLVNSPGPHDVVRVRQPFKEMIKRGIDCRIHERPFRFNECIRPHSIVIWQRPLPESWSRQIEYLQWLRERGCLLFTEWDDHPQLFSPEIRRRLQYCKMAPLIGCHAIHSSSGKLAYCLKQLNPLILVIENTVDGIERINLEKHGSDSIRIFIGNQNRYGEHKELINGLNKCLAKNPELSIVVVGDEALSNGLIPQEQIESYPVLAYAEYRKLLGSCHIALLPLHRNEANKCKTIIKWAEAAAESVATIAGPELYSNVKFDEKGRNTCWITEEPEEMMKASMQLIRNKNHRIKQVIAAHKEVSSKWNLKTRIDERITLYRELWQRRMKIDRKLVERMENQGVCLKNSNFIQ